MSYVLLVHPSVILAHTWFIFGYPGVILGYPGVILVSGYTVVDMLRILININQYKFAN